MIVVALMLLGGLALYVSFAHNRLVFVGFALVLSIAPWMQVPVVHVSVLLLACLGLWVGLATRRRPWPAPSWLEILVVALVVLAMFPVVAHGADMTAVSDYVRWAAAVLVAIPLRVLSGSELATVARVYALGATAAALIGVVIFHLDTRGFLVSRLGALGYASGADGRTVDTSKGIADRLVGPYTDPNVAGFMLVVALILAVALLRGRVRVGATAVLVVAVMLTLSRASMGSMLVATLVLLVAGRGAERARAATAGGLLSGGVALLAVPAVRARLADSFGPRDIGASARLEALHDFPADMAGHWWLGRGFGAPEFVDPLRAAIENLAANAVLHTMLRGGLVVGLALAALLVAAFVAAVRRLRSGRLDAAVVGAGVIGLVLVSIQLDIPLATAAPVAAAFSMLLAVLAHPDLFEDAS